jgi:cell wall-associated NlpC family hydrolase
MADWRQTPATARVAHVSLRGQVQAAAYAEGEVLEVAVPVADLARVPAGARERQVILGDSFLVIDRDGGWCFGQAAKDGYCGWVPAFALAPPSGPTHRVASPGTHLYPEPRVQARATGSLTLGARLRVDAVQGAFAVTPRGCVPLCHLAPVGTVEADPVAVAERFLHVPYLWGGNTRDGLDCSGLVQAALLACGIACPGDSDLQQALGVAAEGPPRRGDLLFWKGHVALVADAATILHANGHHMAVAFEGLTAATDRIAAAGGGPVTAHRRLEGRP